MNINEDGNSVDKIIETVQLAQEALDHDDVATGKLLLADVNSQVRAYRSNHAFPSDDFNIVRDGKFGPEDKN